MKYHIYFKTGTHSSLSASSYRASDLTASTLQDRPTLRLKSGVKAGHTIQPATHKNKTQREAQKFKHIRLVSKYIHFGHLCTRYKTHQQSPMELPSRQVLEQQV